MILPGQRSESTKNIDEIKPELGGFTIFAKDPDQHRSRSDILDTRYSVVLLVRVKHTVPAPRVWTEFEVLTRQIPFYKYYVWMDHREIPVHYWAGSAELITLKESFYG